MYPRAPIVSILVFAFVFAATDRAQAWPRRNGRRSDYYYYSNGIKQIAPKVDGQSEDCRALGVYYSYDHALAQEAAFTDKIRVSLLVRDEEVLATKEPIVAEVKMTDLSDYQTTRAGFFPVSINTNSESPYKLGFFYVENENREEPIVQPARVYRLFVNLHRESAEYGKGSVLGRIPTPYYVATSGDTRLHRARQQTVMRTFKEFYYAENGWRSEETYPMDCYAYYMWATGFCTVGAEDRRTVLHRLFGDRVPYHNGSQIPQIAQQGPVHGDYVRQPGHSFMLLAYDPKLGHVWTMEGNFNSTIEVVIRSVSSGWTVGHLVEDHIRPGMFEEGTR